MKLNAEKVGGEQQSGGIRRDVIGVKEGKYEDVKDEGSFICLVFMTLFAFC